MLNTAYAYLAEKADAADAIAEPAYRAAGVEDREIEKVSHRAALEEWLSRPMGDVAERDKKLVSYLTNTAR